jgi:hypothetical protein
MTEAFHLGGWGMYPTLVSGLVLIGMAFGFAIAPDPRRRALVRALAMLTFLCGTLGFVTGMIKSCLACTSSFEYVVRGFGESLNNIGLALCTLVIAGIGTAIGAARQGEPPSDLHGL